MRSILGCVIVLLCTGCAIAQMPAGGNKLSADSSVDEILDALQARGQGLNDFSADVTIAEIGNDTGDEFSRLGRIWYQKQAEGNARLRVTLDKKQVDKKITEEKIEYLLEGPWLTDRNYRKQIEVKRQVLKPGEKMNLLKLGEGPFPLPIGQDKADVHKLFDVEKIAAAKDDPAGTVHLKLTPKKDTQFARKFKAIDAWIGLDDHMPQRIDTLDANGSTTRSTTLTNVKVNANLTDADFTLPPISEKEWTRHEESFQE